ncbi:PEP-utilizing enzyme [Chloroflexota bacterium]
MRRFLHKAHRIVFLDGDDVRRAPMVAALFKQYVRREPVLRLWNMKVESAGSGQFTKEGAPPDPVAIDAMRALGVNISSHRAKSLSLETIMESSIVLAMEQKHINYVTQHVCNGYPGYNNKVITINDYLGGDLELEKLFGIRDSKVYEDFAKYQQMLFTRVAYLLKQETLYPLLLKGLGMSTGVVEAKVKMVRSPSEARMVNTGDVMVCQSNHVIQLYGQDCVRIAGAILTDSKSELLHLSNLSHEINIPCIGGTGTATKVLVDGQVVSLDITAGLVYERGDR